MSVETLIERLDKVKPTAPERWLARCPAHDDKSPSLSIRVVDEKILIHCFSGCHALDVVHAVGLEMHDLLLEKPCTKCNQMFAPLGPDHDRCNGCFRGDMPDRHRRKPTRRRIPAGDVLQAIDHEALVIACIGADFLKQRSLERPIWDRLAVAVSRIGAARDMTR